MLKFIFLFIILCQTAQAACWECINRDIFCNTWRMPVPNGWIIVTEVNNTNEDYPMIFVPDIKHEWAL